MSRRFVVARSLLGLTLATGLMLASAGEALSQAPRSEYVNVGSHTLHFRISGEEHRASGTPAIILEAGGGNDSRYWAEIQPLLTDRFRTVVVSYDRPGHGESELQAGPYDVREQMDDLRSALTELGVVDEMIMVGHSYGGLLIQVFAARNAERIAGLLFLDPNIPGSHHAFRPWMEAFPLPPEFANPTTDFERAIAQQNEAYDRTMATVFAEAFMPEDLPVVVISAEEGLTEEERLNEAYVLSHQLLAKSFTRGEWVEALGVGHAILPERTDLVVESLAKILGAAR
jgi:pimeloyl-ACP methyl ester carboxylesterase